MIIQLEPPIPMSCPKGNGLAFLVNDPGIEHNLQWTIAIDETGEIWTFQNPDVRMQKNITMGRKLKNEIFVPDINSPFKNGNPVNVCGEVGKI